MHGGKPSAEWSMVRLGLVGPWQSATCTAYGSALVAKFDNEPSFLLGSSATDQRHGYVLLIEVTLDKAKRSEQKFLFVQRLYCPDPLSFFPDPLPSAYPNVTPLTGAVFLEPFTGNSDTRIESLSMHPLGLSKLALRRKLLEAYDVRSTTSSLGLSRTVAGAMKVFDATSNRRTMLRPRNKRLQQSGGRCGFADLVKWVTEMCSEFHNARNSKGLSSPFLSAFAEAVSDISGKTADVCLLEAWVLRDRAQLSTNDKLDFFDNSGSSPQQLTPHQLESTLSALEDFVTLSPTSAPGVFVGKFAPVGLVTDLKIEVMTRTCKLTLPNCHLTVSTGGPGNRISVPLAKFLNDSKLFRITLDNGNILFSSSGIHRDGDMKKSASLLLSIIRTNSKLGRARTEKGKQKTNAGRFDASSVFSLIETRIARTEEWLLCDDSADEWADYVSLSNTSSNGRILRWYHAKLHRHYAKADTARKNPLTVSVSAGMRSASKLQEVVGQAVKNLGRVRLQQPDQDIDDRVELWKEDYAWPDGKKLVSAMPRLRKCPAGLSANATTRIKAFLKECAAAGNSPITRVEVALVIPNYSKARLENSFKKLGAASMAKTTPQVFWLLSGFMSNCIEANVTPVIYCRD
jgi:hypothetical protein